MHLTSLWTAQAKELDSRELLHGVPIPQLEPNVDTRTVWCLPHQKTLHVSHDDASVLHQQQFSYSSRQALELEVVSFMYF